jgi:putative ABC transport system substrate-binding protein
MANKRIGTWLLAGVFLTAVSSAEAQRTAAVPRIGFISPLSSSAASLNVEAFRHGLRELAYVEDKNIAVEYRFADGKTDRLTALVADLIELKVDVIVVGSTPGAVAAKNATRVVPIVMAGASEPVESGLVASIARPGGNVTGLNRLAAELAAKRLELLKEAFPKVVRVAYLFDPTHSSDRRALKAIQATAPALGVTLQTAEGRSLKDFNTAFAAISRERAEALLSSERPLFNTHRSRIIEFAATRRLPAVYGYGSLSKPETSCPMRQACRICTGAQPTLWTGS